MRRLPGTAANVATIAVCLFAAFPIYWMLKGSLEPTEALLDPHLLPRHFTLENYEELFSSGEFRGYLMNSVVIAIGTMLLTVVCATLAGYGLARFQFPGQRVIARSVLFTYMFPPLALAIPLFVVFSQAGLTNSRLGLVIAHSSLTLPFGIWLMWQFFQTVPRSYQESAYSLGAGKLRTMLEVEAPLASPGIIAVAILSFALSWEDYTMAFILTTDVTAKTLPVGMTAFVEQDVIHWGLVQSAGVFVALPALIIITLLQRYLITGLGAGGLKG